MRLAVQTLSAQRVAVFGWIFSIECSPSFRLSGSVLFFAGSFCISWDYCAFWTFLCSRFRQVIARPTTQPWEARSRSQHKKEHSIYIETILCILHHWHAFGSGNMKQGMAGTTARSKFIHCDALHRRLFGCYMDGFESIKASWCNLARHLEVS